MFTAFAAVGSKHVGQISCQQTGQSCQCQAMVPDFGSLQIAAVLRGCFPDGCHEADWVGSEEEVGAKQVQFLKTWYRTLVGREELPLWRKAWSEAFPQLGKGAINTILKKISDVRQDVFRKKRNAKTGEQMPHWIKELLVVLKSNEDTSFCAWQGSPEKGYKFCA